MRFSDERAVAADWRQKSNPLCFIDRVNVHFLSQKIPTETFNEKRRCYVNDALSVKCINALANALARLVGLSRAVGKTELRVAVKNK